MAVSPQFDPGCPLVLDSPGRGNSHSYAQILDDMTRFFNADLSPFRYVPVATTDPVSFDGEREFLGCANRDRRAGTWSEILSASAGRPPQAFGDAINRALALADLTPCTEDRESATTFRRLLPSLRSHFYDLPRTDLALAVAIGAHLVWHTARRSAVRPTLRRMSSLFLANHDLLRLLARATRPVSLATEPSLPYVGDPWTLLTLKAILTAIDRRPGERTLVEWFAEHCRLASLQRVVLLRALADCQLTFGPE